jgi:hypothetical protein
MELKVKYNYEGRYTAGDFYHAGIDHKILAQLIKENQDDGDVKRDVGRVFGSDALLNFLSHDNPGRREVTLTQTRDFVFALKSLIKRCQENKLIKSIDG